MKLHHSPFTFIAPFTPSPQSSSYFSTGLVFVNAVCCVGPRDKMGHLAHPSKHARSDSDPVRIGWEGLARSGPDDSCTPACFRTGSVWQNLHSQPELNRTRAGFAQYYPGRLWINETESKNRKLVAGRFRPARNRAKWFLHTSLLPDQMCLAKPWPGHPDWIRVGLAQMIQAFFGKKRNWNGCGKLDPAYTIRPDSGCTLAVTAITDRNGHNWP